MIDVAFGELPDRECDDREDQPGDKAEMAIRCADECMPGIDSGHRRDASPCDEGHADAEPSTRR